LSFSIFLRLFDFSEIFLHYELKREVRFKEDPSCQVFLSSDAGGVGLNLQSGSVVINMDIPGNLLFWNNVYSIRNQVVLGSYNHPDPGFRPRIEIFRGRLGDDFFYHRLIFLIKPPLPFKATIFPSVFRFFLLTLLFTYFIVSS
jgi:hypothetical protein